MCLGVGWRSRKKDLSRVGSPARSSPHRTTLSLFRCCASWLSSVSRGTTSVGIANLVSATARRSLLVSLLMGPAPFRDGAGPLGRPLTAPRTGPGGTATTVVCIGFSSCLCCRLMLI